MTVAFSGAIMISSQRDPPLDAHWWKCSLLWLAILSLVASGFLAFKCIIDFFLYYLLSVNTPPGFYDEVNRHILYDPKSCGEPATSEHVSFECDTHTNISWATAILEFVGIQSHHHSEPPRGVLPVVNVQNVFGPHEFSESICAICFTNGNLDNGVGVCICFARGVSIEFIIAYGIIVF